MLARFDMVGRNLMQFSVSFTSCTKITGLRVWCVGFAPGWTQNIKVQGEITNKSTVGSWAESRTLVDLVLKTKEGNPWRIVSSTLCLWRSQVCMRRSLRGFSPTLTPSSAAIRWNALMINTRNKTGKRGKSLFTDPLVSRLQYVNSPFSSWLLLRFLCRVVYLYFRCEFFICR